MACYYSDQALAMEGAGACPPEITDADMEHVMVTIPTGAQSSTVAVAEEAPETAATAGAGDGQQSPTVAATTASGTEAEPTPTTQHVPTPEVSLDAQAAGSSGGADGMPGEPDGEGEDLPLQKDPRRLENHVDVDNEPPKHPVLWTLNDLAYPIVMSCCMVVVLVVFAMVHNVALPGLPVWRIVVFYLLCGALTVLPLCLTCLNMFDYEWGVAQGLRTRVIFTLVRSVVPYVSIMCFFVLREGRNPGAHLVIIIAGTSLKFMMQPLYEVALQCEGRRNFIGYPTKATFYCMPFLFGCAAASLMPMIYITVDVPFLSNGELPFFPVSRAWGPIIVASRPILTFTVRLLSIKLLRVMLVHLKVPMVSVSLMSHVRLDHGFATAFGFLATRSWSALTQFMIVNWLSLIYDVLMFVSCGDECYPCLKRRWLSSRYPVFGHMSRKAHAGLDLLNRCSGTSIAMSTFVLAYPVMRAVASDPIMRFFYPTAHSLPYLLVAYASEMIQDQIVNIVVRKEVGSLSRFRGRITGARTVFFMCNTFLASLWVLPFFVQLGLYMSE